VRNRVLFGSIVIGLLAAGWCGAAGPGRIHYQGRLFNQITGEPIIGAVPFTFRLVTTPEDLGDVLWTEAHDSGAYPSREDVLVENGFYEVELGKYVPLPLDAIASATAIYLEIQVLNDEPMRPRQRILAVPYALESQMLGGKEASDFAEAAELIAHASEASAHHIKTTDASEITSGVFSDGRLPNTIARKSDLDPLEAHVDDFDNPHQVTLEQAGAVTPHDVLLGAKGFLNHAAIDAHILGQVASSTTPLYDHTCPEDMVQVGYSCIDKEAFRDTGQSTPLQANWFTAAVKCAERGKRLCRYSEWYVGCANSGDLGVSEIGSNEEWVDQWAAEGTEQHLRPVSVGLGSCSFIRRANLGAMARFRCCR